MEVRIKFTNANNSSTVTLNLNGIGAANVIRHNAGNLFIGDISAGMVGILIYSSGLSGWLLKNPALD